MRDVEVQNSPKQTNAQTNTEVKVMRSIPTNTDLPLRLLNPLSNTDSLVRKNMLISTDLVEQRTFSTNTDPADRRNTMTNTDLPPQQIDSGCNPHVTMRKSFPLKLENLKTIMGDLSISPRSCDRLIKKPVKTPDGMDWQEGLLKTPGAGPDDDYLRQTKKAKATKEESTAGSNLWINEVNKSSNETQGNDIQAEVEAIERKYHELKMGTQNNR